MTDNIKLPPMPRPPLEKSGWTFYDDSDMEAYAREAVRLNAQAVPDEPDWRHPKIQGLIGSEARLRIAIDLIWQILEDPNQEFTASDMEYWDTIHDDLKAALSAAPAAQAVPQGWVMVPKEPTPEMLQIGRHAAPYRAVDVYRAMLAAAAAAPQPAQQTCNCRWVGDVQVQQCTLHQAHVEAIHEWAERAKTAEAKLNAQQSLTDEKDALLRQALEALEGFVHITNDSQGVAGYHLSGDTAEWDEFDEVDAASNTIEAIRNHFGVKND